jgi:1-acyl-sn-glycerol-3-phosphate acyltransferase
MDDPKISPFVLWFFRLIVRVWFQFHFTSVLALNTEPFTHAAATTPLIIYGNHSSWWDPMIAVLLAAKLMPKRSHYAPIDETSLAENGILGKIGIFPIDIRSSRGARQFLQAAMNILHREGVLWITPQGRFADTRESVLAFKPGLASVASRLGGCTLVPLATEYTFWNERRPRALFHFGEPIQVPQGVSKPTLNLQLEQALQQTMEQLKTQSLTRDPANFTRLPLWRKVVTA